jgi:hypothetical protein
LSKLHQNKVTSAVCHSAFAFLPIGATVQQNMAAEGSIARRPSRMMVTKPRQDSNTTGGLAPPGVVAGQAGPVPMMSSSDVVTSNILTGASFGGTTSVMPGGPPIFLRIKVAAKADVHYSTTINV